VPDAHAVPLASRPAAAAPTAGAAPAAQAPPGARRRLGPGRRADLIALASFAALSCWLFIRLLMGVRGRYLTDSTSDQRLFEYYLTWVSKALSHGMNPLVIPVQNAPHGVNGMGNTIVLALAAPLTPVTLLFGAPVSFALAMVLGVTASAWAWYWLFSRVLPVSRFAAAVGAGLVSFSPTMVSHANGHVNMIVNFAIPAIIGLTLRLREPAHRLRRGVALGLFAVVQVLIGAEILLVAALGFGVLLVLYGVQRPGAVRAAWRPVAAGLAVALAVAVPLLAYPLWIQFAGPQHYAGLPFSRFGFTDVLSFPSFATRSLINTGPAHYTKHNLTEENGYFGWPLLLVVAALGAWLWRSAVARAAVFTGVIFAVLSLGNRIHFHGHVTRFPGPWRLAAKLPLLENIIPSRLAYLTVAMVALLVALGVDRLLALPPGTRPLRVPARAWLAALLVVALVPVFPTPLRAAARTPVPAFFTDGTWREYLPADATVVPVPLPRSPVNTYALDWQIAADLDFRIAGGYFIGPWPADRYGPAGHGWYDQYPRPTDALISAVAENGSLPEVTAQDQVQAAEDLRWWGANALVLDPATAPHPKALIELVNELTATPALKIGGIYLWPLPTHPQ
jgi:hypothetical protein